MRHRCPTGKHPQPDRGCYVGHKCRCRGCTELNRQASRFYAELHRKLEGRELEGLTDAEPTRARVRLLQERGYRQRDIADTLGITQSAVSLLLAGQRRIRRSVAARTERELKRALAQDHGGMIRSQDR